MDEYDLDDDALAQLEAWLVEARGAVPQSDTMALATADRHGRPSARIVLLRGIDSDGLVFVDVGDGIIDFRTFFDEQGNKGYHEYLVERDSAPGGSSNPGQSYRTAARSAARSIGRL